MKDSLGVIQALIVCVYQGHSHSGERLRELISVSTKSSRRPQCPVRSMYANEPESRTASAINRRYSIELSPTPSRKNQARAGPSMPDNFSANR